FYGILLQANLPAGRPVAGRSLRFNYRGRRSDRSTSVRSGQTFRSNRNALLSEPRNARGGRTNLTRLRRASDSKTLQRSLTERHQSGVQVAPHEKHQEGNGDVIFILDGVNDRRRKIQSEEHFCIRHPSHAIAISTLEGHATLLAFDPVFWRAHKFGLLADKGFDNGHGVAYRKPDSDRHYERQIKNRAPPRLRVKDALRRQIETRNRARR